MRLSLGAGGGILGVIMLLGAGCVGQQAPAPPPLAATDAVTPDLSAPAGVPPAAGAPDVPEAAPPVAGATIRMTAAGFSPATVTVNAGEAVAFINDDPAAPHWPASAVHPAHTVLPGFDALGGVASGASYVFTFETPGAWEFHDHLNPGFTGQVIVE